MAKTATSTFHFDPSLIKFLKDLKRNNNRNWFNANKQRYEEECREPALAFITALQKPFKKISPHFNPIPKKTGGSLMRVYRDTRFSKDKTPYKSNVGIHIRHEIGRDVHAPGFYFHIDEKEIFIGAGVWHPDNQALKKIRTAIDEDQAKWKRITNAKSFTRLFELRGDTLKRPPREFPADHPLIDDLKRKDHFGLTPLATKELYDKKLVANTIERFAASKPYVRFLCDSLHLPF